jgi:hypothetical protein
MTPTRQIPGPRHQASRRSRRNLHVKTRVTLALLVTLAMVGVYFLGRSHPTAPTTTVPPAKIPITFTGFYLDIGASASLGFQPTGIKGHNGRSTLDGYGDDVVLMERYLGTSLSLYKTGCPGETLQSYLSTKVADHCNNLPTTQLSKDLKYLRAHQSEPGLVTLDMGFNNIRVCLSPTEVEEACVDEAVAAVATDIPTIVKDLKAVSGSQVQFVGLEYNDPFLGHYMDGAGGPADATATLLGMNRMDAALKTAYLKAGIKVADVPAYFRTDDTSEVTIDGVGREPENVYAACNLTWECYSSPFGPDDHPNDAGYSLIAKAILAELPKKW